MQTLPGFARKYAIMEELDGGFGMGTSPEAFVRLDSWEGRIVASLHVKGLKQGPFRYMLYLIFSQGDGLVSIPAGDVSASFPSMQGSLEIDPGTLKSYNTRPELVKYAAITAESKDKMWIPLFASFEKSLKWDESLRQIIHKKAPKKQAEKVSDAARKGQEKTRSEQDKSEEHCPAGQSEPDPKPGRKESATGGAGLIKCDIDKLETLIKNNFEASQPFKRGNPDYTWYQVNDLAKLSNIMYMSGINVPVFANPKILVGLFRYKHILAGLYKGENFSNFFVIGIPARDENDNRPFETACRWVPVTGSDTRDLGGYWLVYVSLRSGEIVV
jgi:hypothetical protein